MLKEIGIPPCPTIVIELVREIGTANPDYKRITDLISSDPGLGAAVLKTVNSPFYGLNRKATSVQQGCVYLGLRTTSLLISGLLLKRAFPEGDSEKIKEFWRATFTTAATAAALAPILRGVDRHDAHTYALFRDCGLAVMLAHETNGDATPPPPAKRAPKADGMIGEFAINHAWIGHVLAQSWYLPDTISHAILHHHDALAISEGKIKLDTPTTRLIALGVLAEQLNALQARRTSCADWQAGKVLVESCFGVKEASLADLAASVGTAGSPVQA